MNYCSKSVSTYLLGGALIQNSLFLDSYNTQHILPVAHPKQYGQTAF
jgi:hypothetical protein